MNEVDGIPEPPKQNFDRSTGSTEIEFNRSRRNPSRSRWKIRTQTRICQIRTDVGTNEEQKPEVEIKNEVDGN